MQETGPGSQGLDGKVDGKIAEAPQEESKSPILTAPLSKLKREDQRLIVNTTCQRAEIAIREYNVRASEGLIVTYEQKKRQKAALDEIAEALDSVQKRIVSWVKEDERAVGEGIDATGPQRDSSDEFYVKTESGTKSQKVRALQRLMDVREKLAKTTHALGEPNSLPVKAPLTQKNTQHNNYFGGSTDSPDPEADLEKYKKAKK